jgi:phosphoribosylaminoimidazolecarboxamide formyltransferase / IMP cyclohydrolase
MPRALISVYNKSGLVAFATELVAHGWELVASGGSEKALAEANLPVTPVEQLTQQPEMLGGRVKTLHPAIHGGILARDRADDIQELAQYGFALIDMVICNLYPFRETVAKPGVTLQDAIEQIDIGGVALLRAAAKNFFRVTTICDPSDYARVLASIRATVDTDIAMRRDLAVKAFAHTRDYDTAIHGYLAGDTPIVATENDNLPAQITLTMQAVDMLRYGENPHQAGAFYSRHSKDTPLGAEVLGGKQLSYNNILDVDAAWRTVSAFSEPTVVIVKHLTPTGIASADNITVAYPNAFQSDPVSAFGGIIAVNRTVDESFVDVMGSLFIEVIAAPNFTDGAANMLATGRKNCRLMKISQFYDNNQLDIRTVHRGFLIQRLDTGDPEGTVWRTVTERTPSIDEMLAMQYAWRAVQHVKSNSIVIAKPTYTVGVGGGLPNRLDAVGIAVKRAGENAKGAALASDAFFPFPDGVEAAIAAGVTAIVQPGGSIRDAQVIEIANKAGITMIFTGVRHFRH